VGSSDPATSQLAQQRARGIRTALIIAAVVVVLRYLPLTGDLFLFSKIENFAYDIAFDTRQPRPPSDIVIIAIDDDSLLPDRLGQWPWPRDVHARLLSRLSAARIVAFDVLFTEPDSDHPAADARFAQAIQQHGRVVLAAYKRTRADYKQSASAKMPAYPRPSGGAGPLQPIQPMNFTPPIPSFAQAAAGIGYVDIEPDSDGVYRRMLPLRVGYDRHIYPHFATEIARLAAGTSPEQVVKSVPDSHLAVAGRSIPLNRQGAALINYCGPTGTVPRYSYWAVLTGEEPTDVFKDKIVLIGASAPGLYDIRPAPYPSHKRFFLGVETNANIVNTLLYMPPLKDSSRAAGALLFALLLGTVAGWMVWSSSEVVGPLVGGLLVVLVGLPSFFVLFHLAHQILPYGAIVLATALPVGLGIYERLGAERRMMREQFSVYVSPDVLQMLMRNPDMIREGRQREVTLLFADVRGSTTLSEKAAPEVWLTQLNEYMSQMTTVIFAYDGYLDKFMGDGIMAIWNAFGMENNHAELAVRAALGMLARLDALNQYWEQAADRTPFRIGIGLHTGEAVMGDAGSDQRRQYTAIGDTVNTASRIEAMNKELGTTLIISETTAQQTEGLFELREIGEMPVRGRSEPIRIFEVLGEKA